jgi:fumarate reductase subunit C
MAAMMQRYEPPVSRAWFVERADFALYAARELTAIPIGLLALDLGVGALCHGHSEAAWEAWLSWHRPWPAIAASAIGLAAVALHAATWFAVSPALLPARVGPRIKRAFSLGQGAVALGIALAAVVALRLLGAP